MVFNNILIITEEAFRNFALNSFFAGTTLGVIIGFLVIMGLLFTVLFLTGFYLYLAICFMTISKKLGYKNSWLAFIPIANLFLLPILAKKHWAWGFLCIIPPVYFIASIIWLWEIYDRRKFPGALSLINLLVFIPAIGVLAIISFLIIIGLVAFSDNTKEKNIKKKSKKRN